jgi:HEAT repeat protein
MSNPIEQLCQLIVEMLRDDPELEQAELVTRVEVAIANHPDLAALRANPQMLQTNWNGVKGFQTWVESGGTVFIEGTHYHLADPEKFMAVLEAILQKWQSPKSEAIDFQPYLQSILNDQNYHEWQDLYTPTTVEARQKMPQQKFSSRLKLRAEIIKPKEEEKETESEREKVEQWDVLAGLRHYAVDHVLLVGKPGSGKSTSLERLLWEEADAVKTPEAKIPVLVKLRRCTSTIEALIQDFLSGHQLTLEVADIKALLQQGKFLLLLDGLNELPEAFRTEIANFRDRYRKIAPMIISTRELSVGGTLDISKTLKMLPLTEPQMQEFVQGYLGEAGNKLFQQLKGDRLRKFAETPLLLWMLCRVFAHNGQVPANLGLAFREFTHLYDEDIQRDAPVDSREQWTKLLSHLAFALMHDQSSTDFRLSIPKEEAANLLTECLQQEGRSNPRECAERWLNDLLKYHLIQPVMQPNFAEHIEFRHQLLQEYYAAEALLPLLPTLSDAKLKRDYLNYLKWTEPIALMLALVEQEAQALRAVRSALEVDLMLGARLAGAVKPAFQKQTVKWIEALDVPMALKVEFLGETRSDVAVPRLVEAIEDSDYSVRLSAAEALGKIGSEAAVPVLLKAIEHPNFSARYNAIEALGNIGSETAIPVLLQMLEDYYESPFDLDVLQYYLLDALRGIGGDGAITGLIKMMKHLDSSKHISCFKGRRRVIRVLGEICSEAAVLELLQATAESEIVSTRRDVIKILREIRSEAAVLELLQPMAESEIEMLLKAIASPNPIVRMNAARELGEIGSEAAVEALLEAVADPSDEVAWRATEALCKVGSEAVIPGLLKKIKHPYFHTRQYVIHILGTFGSVAVVPNLLEAVDDPNSVDRKLSIRQVERRL